jgi:hypothetical protein
MEERVIADCVWLLDEGDAAVATVACYSDPARVSPNYVRRVRRFVRFLAESGVVASSPACTTPAVDPRVTEFLEWLRCHRGLSERTLRLHGQVMRRLLPALGNDPATYDAALVRRVTVEDPPPMPMPRWPAREASTPMITAVAQTRNPR